MYAELKMELDNSQINYQKSSSLQGVLMEKISAEYAEKLHGNQLNPYSQFLVKEANKTLWYIRTLNEEAYENIILPMLKEEKIELKKSGISASIVSRKLETRKEEELLKEFYEKKCPKYLDVTFRTPTAFKRDGKYVNYPDLNLIYGSLMRKYSAVSESLEMVDDETLEALSDQSEIVKYRLQTVPFPLEHIRITGFVGDITIHINGPETMARYARMLFEFGKFSGVGIKTGMGMGAIQYIRRTKDD